MEHAATNFGVVVDTLRVDTTAITDKPTVDMVIAAGIVVDMAWARWQQPDGKA